MWVTAFIAARRPLGVARRAADVQAVARILRRDRCPVSVVVDRGRRPGPREPAVPVAVVRVSHAIDELVGAVLVFIRQPAVLRDADRRVAWVAADVRVAGCSPGLRPWVVEVDRANSSHHGADVADATKPWSGVAFEGGPPRPSKRSLPVRGSFRMGDFDPSVESSGPTGRRVERRGIDDIPRETWDAIATTGTVGHAILGVGVPSRVVGRIRRQRSRRDARVSSPMTVRPTARRPTAIVPFMHRHAVEPGDHRIRRCATAMRELTPVVPTGPRLFFGASYHADYATVLASPADLAAVGEALRATSPVDRGRLGCGRSASASLRRPDRRRLRRRARSPRDRRGLDAQRRARGRLSRRHAAGWIDMEGYLATLGKKERHEIRRKVRRAERVGAITPRRFDRPARRPRDLHRPAPAPLGRRSGCSRTPSGATEPGLLPTSVRAARRRTARSG